ncbi:MAG: hypothetical protein GXP31_00150 [Kiritimatiellaeota bacterium]|nr:hypothetical protein [Kiritimatiellota bacterium]
MRTMTDLARPMRHLSLMLALAVGFAMTNPLRAAEIFTVTMTATGDLNADYLAFGMDDTASDGYDENLDSPAPPAAPSGNNIWFSIGGDISRLSKDYRGQADSAVWTLDVTLAQDASTTLTWTLPGGFTADALEFNNGGTVIDMQTTASVHLTQSGQFTILYRAPTVTNTVPVARDDTASMWPADGNVDIPVLNNDEDLDGDAITVTDVSDPPNGTTTHSDSVITYTPDGGFTGTDTFTYTISDGTETATATVTVTVFPGNVIAVRTHAAFAAPGNDLTVTITVTHNGTLQSLALDETLPLSDDQPPNIWQYVADSYAGPTRAATVSQTDRTLTIDFGTAVPASPFSLSYKVTVPANDTNPKTFSGLVRYRLAGDIEDRTQTIPDTTVQPGIPYHSADYNHDWKIDFTELLRFIAYYNAGGYHADPGNGLDEFAPGTGAITGGYHSGDYHGATGAPPSDGIIQFDELLRVIALYNAGAYHADAGNGLDDFAPGAAR